jgi:Ran GTPase-activating protein (RanGAP) involved in mRNA processing and transport
MKLFLLAVALWVQLGFLGLSYAENNGVAEGHFINPVELMGLLPPPVQREILYSMAQENEKAVANFARVNQETARIIKNGRNQPGHFKNFSPYAISSFREFDNSARLGYRNIKEIVLNQNTLEEQVFQILAHPKFSLVESIEVRTQLSSQEFQRMMELLSAQANIKYLKVGSYSIESESDAHSMANFILTHPDLKSLKVDIRDTQLFQIISHALAQSENLEQLWLFATDYSGTSLDERVFELVHGIMKQRLESLSLFRFNGRVSDAAAVHLKDLLANSFKLKRFFLYPTVLISEESENLLLAGIQSSPVLTEVGISPRTLPDREKFYRTIERNTKLLALDLSSSKISDLDAKYLATVIEKNKTLQEIRLKDNFLTARGLELLLAGLKNNSTLKKIDLSSDYMENNSEEKELRNKFKILQEDRLKMEQPLQVLFN